MAPKESAATARARKIAYVHAMGKLLRVLRSDGMENAAIAIDGNEWLSLERVHSGGGRKKYVIELHNRKAITDVEE